MRTVTLLMLAGMTLAADTLDQARTRLENPPEDARIMMRWWWFGPSATREQVEQEMRAMKAGGIGGFEVQPVYALAPDDPARGFRNYKWLSPEFLDVLKFTAAKAKELGLRMDLTLGSGWSFGGPYITQDLAAGQLRSVRLEVAPNVTSVAKPVPMDGETLLGGYIGLGSLREVDPATFKPLDISGASRVTLPPGNGPRSVVFFFASHTGQVVKRAAIGAEGYVLDHFNRAAIELHLKEAGDKMLDAVGPGGVYSVFCDSLEVYEANWTPDLPQEFRKRRGYDLIPQLPLLEFEAAEQSDALRRDFGRTLTELYEERFLVPMREWARRRGVQFRIQNYGQPPASIASHRNVDLIDGEGWHWRRLDRSKWASSAAHIYGKSIVASETWTWLHSPVFRATPQDVKAEADQHFLQGITQLIGHGWPYSPPQAGSPGWGFYAASVLNDKNPWWPVMPDISKYLQRVSYLLRQGDPVSDVAIYAPYEDAWSAFKAGTLNNLDLYRKTGEWFGPDLIPAILDAGYNFDVIDDETLDLAGKRYKAIVLPNVRWMPEKTAQWLQNYQRSGGTVITVGRKPERAWSELTAITVKELGSAIAKATPSDLGLTQYSSDIGFVHRKLQGGELYFVVNTANVPRRLTARFRDNTPNAELWDPLRGTVQAVAAGRGALDLEMEPYGSRIVVFRQAAGSPPVTRKPSVSASLDLRAGWTLDIAGAASTVSLPHSWANDAKTRNYSGTGTYRREVTLSSAFRTPGTRVFLDFGGTQPAPRDTPPEGSARADSAFMAFVATPVRDAATIYVNGKPAGTVWCAPFRLDVTDLLQNGSNDIRVEVYNTAVNQLVGDAPRPDYKRVLDTFGLRFRMQELENLQVLPSGILSVPRLVAER